MNNEFSRAVEKKTGVRMNDIMRLANSVQGINLQSEAEVRKLIKQVSRLAGRPVSRQKEDMIVDMLVKQNKSIDANTIAKMLGKK